MADIIITDPQGFFYGIEFSDGDWIQSEDPTHIGILDEFPEEAGTYHGKIKYDDMTYYSDNSEDAEIYFYPDDEGLFSETLNVVSDAETAEIEVSGEGKYSVNFVDEKTEADEGNHIYGCEIEQVIASAMPESFITSQVNREIKEAVQKHPELDGIQNLKITTDKSKGFISFDLVKKDSQIINGVEVKL